MTFEPADPITPEIREIVDDLNITLQGFHHRRTTDVIAALNVSLLGAIVHGSDGDRGAALELCDATATALRAGVEVIFERSH